MASVARKSVANALLALIAGTNAFETTGRRVIPWSKCPAQPAFFLVKPRDTVAHEGQNRALPPTTRLHFSGLIYSKTVNVDGVPADGLDDLIDIVETALTPAPGLPQTLGGLVRHCWIEGNVEYHPGDLGAQAVANVPIVVLVP